MMNLYTVGNPPPTSYRRKPVSRNLWWLRKYWTPASAGVTILYLSIKKPIFVNFVIAGLDPAIQMRKKTREDPRAE
jgi:hypothetical protein